MRLLYCRFRVTCYPSPAWQQAMARCMAIPPELFALTGDLASFLPAPLPFLVGATMFRVLSCGHSTHCLPVLEAASMLCNRVWFSCHFISFFLVTFFTSVFFLYLLSFCNISFGNKMAQLQLVDGTLVFALWRVQCVWIGSSQALRVSGFARPA